ncbi:MAG: Ppx/GppA phosphatase family protein [Actinomycetota bacterium]
MAPSSTIAVVDLGSNSGRVVVVAVRGAHLEIVAEARTPLRLADELRDGRLTAAGVRRTVSALQDFVAVAHTAGAGSIIVAATSAVRESSNASELARAIKEETGLALRILDGEEEARYAFAGAVRALDVTDGALLDVGGGSAEITMFRSRVATQSWTLPIGALRVTRSHFASDPPSSKEIKALREYLVDIAREQSIPRLSGEKTIVATGGTARTIARVMRHSQGHPIRRIHGFEITNSGLNEVVSMLTSRSSIARSKLRGVNRDRADSIAGGGVVLQTLCTVLGASLIVVSGQGLREGIAAEELNAAMPDPRSARADSVRAVCKRFKPWNQDVAMRRSAIAAQVAVELGDSDQEQLELLGHAAMLVDAGRAIDPYNHDRHAAFIALEADLSCFTHRQLAIIASLLARMDDYKTGVRELRKMLTPQDHSAIAITGCALLIADALVARIPPSASVQCSRKLRTLQLEAPCAPGRWSRDADERLRRDTGLKLVYSQRAA